MNPWESPQFTAWVDAVFSHPVSEPEWYWDDNFDEFWTASERPPTDTVELLRLLFSLPAPLLTRYRNDQIAQGIWFIAGEASPGRLCYALIDDSVQLDTRVRCIREIYTLFRDLFAVACSGSSRHSSDPLHVACYMWWDIFPSWGVRASRGPVIDGACLDVMTRTLEIPVEVCQIAALHGLNHWYLHHGEEVEAIVDGFLRTPAPVSKEVREYAGLARKGGSQ
jgi:hypothetical protein